MTAIAPSSPLAFLDGLVIDTETTGLDSTTARLVQVAGVRIKGGRVGLTAEFNFLVNPGIPIPVGASAIHGLTDQSVCDAPTFRDVAVELQRAFSGQIVIGHAIAYDLDVLAREAERAGLSWTSPPSLDIRLLAEILTPGVGRYDLDSLAKQYGVEISGRHSALGDAMATARLFMEMTPRLRQRGIRTLAEADKAQRHLRERQMAAGVVAGLSQESEATVARTIAARVDSFPYRYRVEDVMSAPALWCPPDALLSDAVRLMVERKVSSVLVQQEHDGPGIATERDVLRALARYGVDAMRMPISKVITLPLRTIPEGAFVYRAIARMERLGLRHLAVRASDDSISGMLTVRNLLRNRMTTALVLDDALDVACNGAELAAAWTKLPAAARGLVADGVGGWGVTAVISTEICAATRRAAELAERQMVDAGKGPPPTAYAVLVLGSAGRGESLLAADQDNAIVFAKGGPGGAEDQWFALFAEHLAITLDEAGIALCKGGVMARTPSWRGSSDTWLDRVDKWVRRQRPEDLLNVDIFFDGTVVHGDADLGEMILAHAFDIARRARDFQVQLSEVSRRWRSPLSLFGRVRVDPDSRIDLKKHGLLPICTSARALAIGCGIRERSTRERLEAVARLGRGNPSDINALLAAHQELLRLILEQQILDGECGSSLSSRIDLRRLDGKAKTELKGALATIAIAVDLVSEGRL